MKRPKKDPEISDAMKGRVDLTKVDKGIPLARYTMDLYDNQLPCKPLETGLLGAVNVLLPPDACGITAYAADTSEDISSRAEEASEKVLVANDNLENYETLYNTCLLELQKLNACEDAVPHHLILAKQRTLEVVGEAVRRAKAMRGRAQTVVDTISDYEGATSGDIVNVLTAIAHEIGLKIPHSPNNPLTIPLSWSGHIYSEELYLILAFLYPGRYTTGLDSLEMTMIQEQEDRLNAKLDRVMTGVQCTKEEALDHLAKGKHLFLRDEHGESQSSPFFQSCEDPINIPVMSRLFATTMAAYAEHKLESVHTETNSILAANESLTGYHLRAANLALSQASSHPILRILSSTTLTKWAKSAVGCVCIAPLLA